MDKTIKFGKRHSLWLFLPVLLILLSACSKETDGSETDPTNVPVKFSLDIVSPEMGSTVLASIAGGNDIDTRFYSRMNEGTSRTVLIKQEGKIINLGSCPVSLSNTAGTEGRIEVDGTDKVEANKPYDVYVLGCGARWEDGEVFYKGEMSRGSGFYTWTKFSSAYRPTKATMNICGTGELLFVINKSGAPIKFRHKGFSATEKWYYKYAEVSTSSGNVVNSEDGEVESEARDVPVFTGNNARSIYSVYVPNGKKIQDAQLIAEINGVEVRSTNRISSDVTLQTNQSYAMFVVWDGEKLMMGDGDGDPVVVVCSGDAASGIIVNEVRSDGTVILSASSTTIPKEGEIIVSGVSAAAPRGFLYHVESVQQSGNQVVIQTSPAYLNEVLKDAHIEQRLSFREATPSAGAPIHMGRYAPTRATDFDLFKWKGTFSISDTPGDSIAFMGMQIHSYVKGSLNVGVDLGGTFIYDSDGFIPDRVGVTLDGSVSVDVTIEAGIKGEYKKEFAEVQLEPFTFMVGIIPVVICPNLVWKYGIRTAEGKVYAKWKPIDIEAAGFEAHLIWNKEENLMGENWDYGASTTSDFSDWSWKSFFKDMLNLEAGLEGEVKFSVWPELEFELYNLDNVALSTGLEPYAKLKGELALKWQANDWSWNDFELKDNLSLSVGLDIPMEGKVEFSLFGKKFGGKLSHSLTLFDYPLIEGATFFPVFNNFSVFPEDNVNQYNSVHVSATKGARLFTFFGEQETDFGFCYAPLIKDNSGNNVPGEWVYISLRDKYASENLSGTSFEMETDILTHNLSSGTTYEVRPYTTVGQWGVVKRKGGKIKTGGSVSGGGGTIIDIPGENLKK